MTARAVKKRPNLKSIALPAEHGGWGFLLEPVLLGLIAAFSGAGVVLALGMLGAFLLHQPLKIALKDRAKGRRTERTGWAERFILLYGGTAGLIFAWLILSQDLGFLLPLLLALPLIIWQFWYDLLNQSRALIAELCGAVALGAIAPSIALLAGWAFGAALVLWALVALRAVPSILYVRARLRLERGKSAAILSANAAHGLAFLLGLPLVIGADAPLISLLLLAFLGLRSLWGLSAYRKPAARPAIIGIQELIYGILFALGIGLGYAL